MVDFDLLILSAFGRGHWLASETASLGWKVCLLDLSEACLQARPGLTIADGDGPFGLFEAPELLKSQLDYYRVDPASVPTPHGFTLWTKSGPLEFDSLLTDYGLRARNFRTDVVDYLREPTEAGRRGLVPKAYSETWLANFAHDFVATEKREGFNALNFGTAAPLFSAFSVRSSNTDKTALSLSWLTDLGVRVIEKARLTGIDDDGKRLTRVVFEDVSLPAINARNFVSLLSGEETTAHSANLARTLFPKGTLKADWSWRRLRFEIRNFEVANLPLFAVVLEDEYLPLSHANAFIIRKVALDDPSAIGPSTGTSVGISIDVWSKWPSSSETDTDSLTKILARRLPGAVLKLTEQAPPAAPVFNPKTLASLSSLKRPNYFFAGPETWEFCDTLGQYRSQNQIYGRLTKLKAQWDAALAKRLQKEAST